MKTIEIEDDLYKYILNNIEAFGETPSQILRRLLVLSEETNGIKEDLQTESVEVVQEAQPNIPPKPRKVIVSQPVTKIESSEHFKQGIGELFNDPAFKTEPIITNKFMMMLTTMYFEKTALFIESAEKTKGRTRAYLGTNLHGLLNSDNEEELAQFKASKPRLIPQTPFWVITNANTGRKRIILTQMMASMGYPHHLIERIKEEI